MARESGYIAFISYSHGDNVERGRKWADWLKREIEKYRIPRDLVGDETEEGTVPSRMPEVFLDKSDLPPGGELNEKLENALKQSRFLLVICSPHSARSHYVDLEIACFERTHDWRRVILIVIDGDLDPGSDACWIPERVLKFIPGEGDIEKRLPLYLDYRTKEKLPDGREFAGKGWSRPEKYGAALKRERGYGAAKRRKLLADYKRGHKEATNKLISALLGVRPRQLETQADHEEIRRQRSTLGVSVAVAVLMAALAGLAFYFYQVADRERVKAERSLQMIGDAHEGATRLISEVLVDLKARLEPAGQDAALQSAQRIVDEYFDENELRGEDDDSMHMRSVILNSRGYLARLTGDFPRAEECYGKAFEIREKLLERDPAKAIFQHNLAVSYDNLGDLRVAMARKEHDEADKQRAYLRALRDYRASLRWVGKLAAAPDTPPQWRHDLAMSHFKIGSLLGESGDKEAALGELQAGLPYARELAQADPDYAKWQAHLGLYYREIGRLQGLSGQFDEAPRTLRMGRDIFRQLKDQGRLTSQYAAWLGEIDEFLLDFE